MHGEGQHSYTEERDADDACCHQAIFLKPEFLHGFRLCDEELLHEEGKGPFTPLLTHQLRVSIQEVVHVLRSLEVLLAIVGLSLGGLALLLSVFGGGAQACQECLLSYAFQPLCHIVLESGRRMD